MIADYVSIIPVAFNTLIVIVLVLFYDFLIIMKCYINFDSCVSIIDNDLFFKDSFL